jgi:hypothetical protein
MLGLQAYTTMPGSEEILLIFVFTKLLYCLSITDIKMPDDLRLCDALYLLCIQKTVWDFNSHMDLFTAQF